jgi:hypothetical protein
MAEQVDHAERAEHAERAVLRIVLGEPTPEEVAIVTALVAASGGDVDEAPPPPRGGWNDPAWQLRRPLAPGRGAWHAAVR